MPALPVATTFGDASCGRKQLCLVTIAMKYDPDKHHRRSIRLRGYDYAQAGGYFVTIVTRDRACLFGEVVNGEMRLNDSGGLIHSVWDELPDHYPGVESDAFVVMPNHIHGVVMLVSDVGAGPCACPNKDKPESGQPQGVAPTMSTISLPDVVHRFKTLTTKRYIDGVKLLGWPPFAGRLWQRNYYEHIVRGENELNRIRESSRTIRCNGRWIERTRCGLQID